MTNKQSDKAAKAEQDLNGALTNSRKTLGTATPRLLTEKPLIAANSLRHGLTGQTVFLTPVQLRAYLKLGVDLMNEYQPITPTQILWAQRIIDAEWRLNTAIALTTTVHTSCVILETQLIHDANPYLAGVKPGSAEFETAHSHAQAAAAERECSGANTLEKLGRHEVRLTRSLKTMRSDYWGTGGPGTSHGRENWSPQTSPAFAWYLELAALADRLVEAREELAQKTESITSTNNSASPQSLLCNFALRLTRPLSKKAAETLSEAYQRGLLTELEQTLFPLPG